MRRASRLSALLFRVLNSPLRGQFFEAKDRSGEGFLEVIEKMLGEITSAPEFLQTHLVRNTEVDDTYWNDGIYREIPANWLSDFLANHPRQKA